MSVNTPSTASSNTSCEDLSEVLRHGAGQRLWEEPIKKVTPLDNYPTSLKGSLVCVSEEEKVTHDFSGDVDLFSVTLAALAGCGQEKREETGDEVGRICEADLQTDNSDSESGGHTFDEQNGWWTQNREDEEEEELSEYISHH